MSFGHRPRPHEMRPNSRVLDEAVQTLLKTVRVDRTHDVPYVGSCNRKGDVIYIDYELPAHFTARGRRVDIDRYVVMHEVVEMLFEHRLAFHYRDAHQMALLAERALMESDGVSWTDYSRFCSRWAKRSRGRTNFPNIPADLDLQSETR